ncbi:hypothetical protein [Pseudoneobacillus rhizosphaerae]|uniref:Uncharacterized protein n=1 Tax=Pseudoneobacillus rhizosphaerae TaxID=2880968 RepID=A0A9C7G5Z7_9BACI|nr:hypothetical protein [Pseudoneobacillus rhizosphaerae]CAG9606576.1 hypothetical protein NEOCIP111885_00264 [Pseudoneobacillus rhizosphaerae]
MSVSVKKKKRVKNHFTWLQVLSKLRSIVILGCKGNERYELVRSYLSPSFCLQDVWRNIMFDKTYVLYPSITNELYVKRENNQVESCENIHLATEDEIVFVPVDPSQLPSGSMMVIPPAILEKELHSVIWDPMFRNQRTEFVWVEAFPYGKSESINALLHLEKEYEIQRNEIHYAFIESQRNFAYTDLDTIQEAMEVAKQVYRKEGFRKSISIIHGLLSPYTLSLLMTEEMPYTEKLLNEIHQVVEKNKRQCERFFEEDYLDIVVELRLPIMLEEVFDYQALKKIKKKKVFDQWMDQMEEYIFQKFTQLIKRLFIQDLMMDTIYPLGNYQTDLQKLLESEWIRFKKELKREREMAENVTLHLDAIQYATAIKDVKVQLKHKLTSFIEMHFFEVLNTHILYVFGLWNREGM